MFKHKANYEADLVSDNMLRGEKKENDTHAVPHAAFTHPQVGSVGLTEMEAYKAGHKILVGRAKYGETAMGHAMGDEDGLAKIVVEKRYGKAARLHDRRARSIDPDPAGRDSHEHGNTNTGPVREVSRSYIRP